MFLRLGRASVVYKHTRREDGGEEKEGCTGPDCAHPHTHILAHTPCYEVGRVDDATACPATRGRATHDNRFATTYLEYKRDKNFVEPIKQAKTMEENNIEELENVKAYISVHQRTLVSVDPETITWTSA